MGPVYSSCVTSNYQFYALLCWESSCRWVCCGEQKSFIPGLLLVNWAWQLFLPYAAAPLAVIPAGITAGITASGAAALRSALNDRTELNWTQQNWSRLIGDFANFLKDVKCDDSLWCSALYIVLIIYVIHVFLRFYSGHVFLRFLTFFCLNFSTFFMFKKRCL